MFVNSCQSLVLCFARASHFRILPHAGITPARQPPPPSSPFAGRLVNEQGLAEIIGLPKKIAQQNFLGREDAPAPNGRVASESRLKSAGCGDEAARPGEQPTGLFSLRRTYLFPCNSRANRLLTAAASTLKSLRKSCLLNQQGLAPLAARPGEQPTGLFSLRMSLFVIEHICRKPQALACASTLKSLRSFGKKKSEGLKNHSDFLADDYERSQNCPFSKGVTMKGLVALYLYIIARKIADRKVFPYGRQLLFPGDCYALDYAYFEVEIQGISISHNHVFDDGTEYLSVVLVQTPHIT